MGKKRDPIEVITEDPTDGYPGRPDGWFFWPRNRKWRLSNMPVGSLCCDRPELYVQMVIDHPSPKETTMLMVSSRDSPFCAPAGHISTGPDVNYGRVARYKLVRPPSGEMDVYEHPADIIGKTTIGDLPLGSRIYHKAQSSRLWFIKVSAEQYEEKIGYPPRDVDTDDRLVPFLCEDEGGLPDSFITLKDEEVLILDHIPSEPMRVEEWFWMEGVKE